MNPCARAHPPPWLRGPAAAERALPPHAGIQADVGAYTEDAAKVALGVGLAVLAWQGSKQLQQQQQQRPAGPPPPGSKSDKPEKVAHAKE